MFDAARYEREVLRPLRGTHGQLPPTNLSARYAVEPGMNAEELTARLAEVRQWWGQRAEAPDFGAEVCKLLIRTDEQLRATAGEAMNDPAWWEEQTPIGIGMGRGTEVPTEPSAPPESAKAGAPAAGRDRDWRADARNQFWALVATLERQPIAIPSPPGNDDDRSPPLPAPPYLDGLRIDAIGADGDRCRVAVSWPFVEATDVRVRWARVAPDFATGDEIPLTRAESWGTAVTGAPQSASGRQRISTVVPTGYLIYVPFAVTGDRAVAGRPVGCRLAGPVDQLRIERRGEDAVLSWVWPPGSSTAIVEWTSGGASTIRQLTLSEYTAENGCAVTPARDGGTATVRAVCAVGPDLARSPERTVSLPPAPVNLRYTQRPRGTLFNRRAQLEVVVTTDRSCSDLDLSVVVSTESTLPMSIDDGVLVHEERGLALIPDEPFELRVPWPKAPTPYWIRCFFRAGYPCSVEIPPLGQMRIT